MTTDQATFLRDFLLQGIEEEFTATRRVLAAVPEAQRSAVVAALDILVEAMREDSEHRD